MRHAVLVLALTLWAGAALRDGFDAWVDATVLPDLQVETGVEVLDRGGRLLRAYTVEDGRWRLALSRDAVDPLYVSMLIAFEDRRFREHAGVDGRAVLRAAWQAVRHGRLVSGGSTLTMQVARLIEEGPTGTWTGKLRQIRVALALERRLDKDRILDLYLVRAPFGGNIEGLRAASLAWFDKPPRHLSAAEAALLVALPQAPALRRPDRAPAAAQTARDRVLARAHALGVLDARQLAQARATPVPATRHTLPALAPHLADRARAAAPDEPLIRLTLDADLQSALETLAARAVAGRSDRLQVAIVVADHRDGAVLASVGSAAFAADGRGGFIDLTEARRSPGSTLKPLVYALGFDRGLIHPETLVADRPTDFAGYRPQNFDGQFRGELRVRDALRLSLNVPAVAVTEAVGPWHLMAAMRRAGMTPEVPGDRPGLAVALGGAGVSLSDLVRLYGGLARQGEALPLHWRAAEPPAAPDRIVGNVAAWQVADILRQVPRPVGYRAPEIAYKTGTSYGHRDAWALGFDGRHVIGVWMGRADGTPVPGAFGGDLAAPVMFAAFARVAPEATALPPPPPATLLVATGDLPPPLRRFGPAAEDSPLRIAFPPDGAVIEGAELVGRVAEGRAPFTWLADGRPVARVRVREADLGRIGPGFATLTVIDADGQAARVSVELRPAPPAR